GNYTTNQQGHTTGIELSGNPSFRCISPSFPATAGILGNERGCVPVDGSASMEFFGTTSTTYTATLHAHVPFPYNAASCPDNGMDAQLELVAPPTSPPLPSPNTPSPVCPKGDCDPPQAGGPINLINGNTWIEQQDFALPGLGGGLELTRTWNSTWPSLIAWPGGPAMDTSGMFGHSWRSTYEERLQTLTGGITKYWRADGNS